MKNVELTHNVIEYLIEKSKSYETRPQRFAPMEIVRITGGAPTAVGHVADLVVEELQARGINVKYERVGKRYFVLL